MRRQRSRLRQQRNKDQQSDAGSGFSPLRWENLIAGLVGGQVDPEKLDQMPQLLNLTTASLIISGVALGLLSIPIRRLMQGVGEQRERRPETQVEIANLDLAG